MICVVNPKFIVDSREVVLTLITEAGTMGPETVMLRGRRQRLVRVLVRDREEPIVSAHAGAESAAGALEVPATIDAATAGVSVVVLVSPAITGLELTVIESAVRASAGYSVKVTGKASPDSPIARRLGPANAEAFS
jgi:hypothetical protein